MKVEWIELIDWMMLMMLMMKERNIKLILRIGWTEIT